MGETKLDQDTHSHLMDVIFVDILDTHSHLMDVIFVDILDTHSHLMDVIFVDIRCGVLGSSLNYHTKKDNGLVDCNDSLSLGSISVKL